MQGSRPRSLVIALLVALTSTPLWFLAGVYLMAGWMYWKSGPVGGEAQQGAAFTAFLFGGPIGLAAGSVVAGGLAYRNAERLSWPAAIFLLAALAAASGCALREVGAIGN